MSGKVDFSPYRILPDAPPGEQALEELPADQLFIIEGDALNGIIGRAEELAKKILAANEKCHELDASYNYYCELNCSWEHIDTASLAALQEIRVIENQMARFLIERDDILEGFSRLDATCHVIKLRKSEADKFREILDTIKAALSTLKTTCPPVKEKWAESVKHLGLEKRVEVIKEREIIRERPFREEKYDTGCCDKCDCCCSVM